MNYTTDETTAAMGRMNITGNITPQIWYRKITLTNGKPDAIAVILLSEIVYWYRPREIRDETTGAVIGFRKRFKADKLQRTYESFSDQFGFTKRQISDAMHRLEARGVIDLDFRTIVTDSGNTLGNVLYIGLDPSVLGDLTFSDQAPYHVITGEGLSRSSGIPYHVITGHPITLERETCTKTTCTETTIQSSDVVDVPPSPPSAAAPETADPVLAQVVALYEQEIGGCLTAMIYDDITDLVTNECRDLERWRQAFKDSIGARNRWRYAKACILNPERKPPKEVNRAKSPQHGSNRRSGHRASGKPRFSTPSPEEIERLNREAGERLRLLGDEESESGCPDRPR